MNSPILLIIILLVTSSLTSSAQKKKLDFNSFQDWPIIKNERLSPDGAYLSFSVEEDNRETIFIQFSNGSWGRSFPGGKEGQFAFESNFFIALSNNDSLFILNLKLRKIDTISGVRSFKVSDSDTSSWFSYQTSEETRFRNLKTNREYLVKGIFPQLNIRRDLAVYNSGGGGVQNSDSLYMINLKNGKITWISNNTSVQDIIFSNRTDKLLFLEKLDETEHSGYRIMSYDLKSGALEPIVERGSPGFDDEFEIRSGALWKVDDSNGRLYFKVHRHRNINEENSSKVGPIVWNYSHRYLPDETAKGLRDTSWLMAIELNPGAYAERIENSTLIKFGNLNHELSNGKLLIYRRPDYSEANPKLRLNAKCYLYANSKLHIVFDTLSDISNLALSPEGKFVIWYDKIKRNYFVYRVDSRLVSNLTDGMEVKLFDEENDYCSYPDSYGIMGWLPGDSAVLIYDRYDIWMFFVGQSKAPINITKGVGRKSHLVFRFVNTANYEYGRPLAAVGRGGVLLSVFNELTKDNGFYQIDFRKNKYPEKLTMGSYSFYCQNLRPTSLAAFPYPIIRSSDGSSYLVRRMSSRDYPNIFVTHDFRSFRQITKFEPQNKYNWLTSELVHWISNDGQAAEGILYRPEDFDSTKKYPMIVYYYEKFSDELNFYLDPKLSDGALNIPHYVSNGYLVFVPNIYYRIGYPGESAYSSVFNGVKYLSSFSWVDSSCIGLQGHSFGGYETNYILCRTGIFAAAVSAAGLWNLTSGYNSIRESFGISAQYLYETDQFRIGGSMNLDALRYIENSPIFMVNKINTPILLMHNRKDGAVPFSQDIEGFLALRRENKPVWMLEYAEEGHSLRLREFNKVDFSIKMFEFFNFYLKSAAMPNWMR